MYGSDLDSGLFDVARVVTCSKNMQVYYLGDSLVVSANGASYHVLTHTLSLYALFFCTYLRKNRMKDKIFV